MCVCVWNHFSQSCNLPWECAPLMSGAQTQRFWFNWPLCLPPGSWVFTAPGKYWSAMCWGPRSLNRLQMEWLTSWWLYPFLPLVIFLGFPWSQKHFTCAPGRSVRGSRPLQGFALVLTAAEEAAWSAPCCRCRALSTCWREEGPPGGPVPEACSLWARFIIIILFSVYLYSLEANHSTILQWFLPCTDMNQPWVYMCSPSRSPLPPPSPSHPSGSPQCTSPEHLSHASSLGWHLFHPW